MPIVFILEKNEKTILSRLGFVLCGLLAIFVTRLGVKTSINAEYYYLAAMILPIILFDPKNRKYTYLSMFFCFFFWALHTTLTPPALSPYWIPEFFPISFFLIINPLGALCIIAIFLQQYVELDTKLRNELAKVNSDLATERSKSIHQAKLASLGEMSAGVAHEINNPLAIIAGSLPALEKSVQDPDKFSKKIQTIQHAVDRISKIVMGLKKFSRSSEIPVYQIAVLADILHESLVLIDAKAKRHHTAITTDIQSNATILCDVIEIEQVLINLINNAIDAVSKLTEKWVQIQLYEEHPKMLVLRIRDSGMGIPESVQQKLFQPFFTTKPVGKGTGLGLSITKGILDQHHASIVILNDPHTCFELRFSQHPIESD
jgi:signal transduction histidine kinase